MEKFPFFRNPIYSTFLSFRIPFKKELSNVSFFLFLAKRVGGESTADRGGKTKITTAERGNKIVATFITW